MRVLDAINPSAESMQHETFSYKNLKPQVEENRPYEYRRLNAAFDAEQDTLEESQAVREAAMHYLLMTAQRLQEVGGEDRRALLSRRYTEASAEIYGSPEHAIAVSLLSGQRQALSELAGNEHVDAELTVYAIDEIDALLGEAQETTPENNAEAWQESAQLVGDELRERYGHVFALLEPGEDAGSLQPGTVASYFEKGLEALAETEQDWAEWSVFRDAEKASLSVNGGKKRITVGMQRAAIDPQKLSSLFAHEVLVHGGRAVNGARISPELASGLPDYLDAEEGLGVFFEYAISGEIPEKNIDRYVDIAIATGGVSGEPVPRKRLHDFALARELVRTQAREGESIDVGQVETEVQSHIKRIYRGSLGNEHVAVFTKDIAYQKGFVDIADYVSSRLEEGEAPGQVIDQMLLGKYDPTNRTHVAYIESRKDN